MNKARKEYQESDEEDLDDEDESEGDSEFDYDMDIDDAIVQTIDGVMMKVDDEEVRMLFYHHKPNGIDFEDEVIKCRGIAECRTTKRTFNNIIKYLTSNWKIINRSLEKTDNNFQWDILPMFG